MQRPRIVRASDPTLALISIVIAAAAGFGFLPQLVASPDLAISVASLLVAGFALARWLWENRRDLTIDGAIGALSEARAAAIDSHDALAARAADDARKIAAVRSALAGLQLSPAELSGILAALGPDPDADTVRVASGEIVGGAAPRE